jgi:hypothetical protein
MAQIVRIIPERTIDAWTSSAILDREPRALVWAPTPPGHVVAGSQPWHFPIGAFDPPGKLLVLTNKALIGRVAPCHFPKISVELDQLARLVDLELDGLPILYGLPCLYDRDVPDPLPHQDFGAHALLRLRPHFDRWQRIVRPLELFSLRPVLKAVVANRRTMTLNTLSLVGFPSLRALLSNTGGAPWGKNLPADPNSRGKPLLPPFKPDSIVKHAVRLAACMGQATPSEMERRLRQIYSQPDIQARMADRQPESAHVDVHLNRTIWLMLPALQRDRDSREAPVKVPAKP